MRKKYIIEIPEDKIADFVGSTHFLMPYIMAGHIGHHDTGLPIEPYTAPDLEQVRIEAYEKGRKDVETQFCSYDACKNRQEEYQRGLADAWEAAKKIALMDTETSENVTGYFGLFRIMENLTPMQAIEKIRQYEQEKRFCVGDEFENESGKRFVIIKMDGTEIDRYMDWEGLTYCMIAKYKVIRKTGRNFPEIAAVLAKMKETE